MKPFTCEQHDFPLTLDLMLVAICCGIKSLSYVNSSPCSTHTDASSNNSFRMLFTVTLSFNYFFDLGELLGNEMYSV